MRNAEKAARVIDQWTQEGYELNSAVGNPYAIVERLAGAGLLAPDLPEPNDHRVFVPRGQKWALGGEFGPSVWTAPNLQVMVQHIEPGKLTPNEARQVAYALLAAANYSEEG